MSRIFILLCFFPCICNAMEFIYPVAYCSSRDTLFMVHQKSIDTIELLAWNIRKGKSPEKALAGFFVPAGLKMLPDEKGFSFIHNDTVYIKQFCKRSPKRIEFYEPLYGINTVEWIDSENFYFFAKEHQRLRIYQANIQGDVQRIVDDDAIDALYPQKIGNDLFYIERNKEYYNIIRTSYFSPSKKESLCVFNDKTIAFLRMISDKEGFFLEYPRIINHDEKTILFWYHQVAVDKNDIWQSRPLFSFSIPVNYLTATDDNRLYESILPFIPRYYNGCLYYADSSHKLNSTILDIFSYEIEINKITQLTFGTSENSYFAFLIANSNPFFGCIAKRIEE